MIRADIVKMYKDVHTWVGIFSGLALFIAFYAGAITMFEGPLKQWASPPSQLSAPVSLEATQTLVDATLAEHPEAAKGYTIHVETGPQTPARMSWIVWPEGRSRGAPNETWYSALGEEGRVEVSDTGGSEAAEFVDVLHQQVGLPFDHEVSMLIMGGVSLLYAVALVSGVIIFLPGFVKDLFAVRLGRNLKRMWLDVHNVLGIFSLPFHVIMAVTAVVFAFHDQFYDTQNKVAYDGQLGAMFEANEPVHHVDYEEGMPFLSPDRVIARMDEQVSGFRIKDIRYSVHPNGEVETMVNGERPGYNHRGPDYGIVAINAYTGDVMSAEYLPGEQGPWSATATGFFALHFGNFGGAPVRWAYVALGLAGAFLFYSGNLLWIESRRAKVKRSRPSVVQPLKTRLLGPLTIGVPLGCVAGISFMLASEKLLMWSRIDAGSAHNLVYYSVFLAAVAWAYLRGTARAAVELQYLTIVSMLSIPVVSLLSEFIPGVGWNHANATVLVDLLALAAAIFFTVTAAKTRKRSLSGPQDSIWYAGERTSVSAVPAE